MPHLRPVRMSASLGLAACLSLGVLSPPAAHAEDTEMQFHFTQLKEGGVVRCAVYTSQQDYLKKSYREVVGKVEGGRAVCVFLGLPAGTYALGAFHDANNNGELDTGAFGIPKEGVCASNNAKGTFGPAKYKDASFPYAGGPFAQELRMRYR